jgi:hypothetical protein
MRSEVKIVWKHPRFSSDPEQFPTSSSEFQKFHQKQFCISNSLHLLIIAQWLENPSANAEISNEWFERDHINIVEMAQPVYSVLVWIKGEWLMLQPSPNSDLNSKIPNAVRFRICHQRRETLAEIPNVNHWVQHNKSTQTQNHKYNMPISINALTRGFGCSPNRMKSTLED